MTKKCCLWVFGLIFLAISVPNENPPEEGPDVKYSQFAAITVHADNQIKEIVGIKNIAEDPNTPNKYYYGMVSATTIDTYSSSSFSSDDTLEKTVGSLNSRSSHQITRELGGNIYSFYTGDDTFNFNKYVHNNDGGWGSGQSLLTADPNDRGEPVDIFLLGAVLWTVFVYYDDSAGTYTLVFSLGAGLDYTGSTYTSFHHCFGGCINADGDYEFVDYVGGKFYYNTFDGTANSTQGSEITEITGITNFDLNNQLYWHKGEMRFLMSRDALFVYNNKSSTWTSKTVDDPTDTNGVIWGRNADNEYIVLYLFWNDQIWKMFKNGGIASIQTLESIDAYTGHDDWFSTGSAIYQLTK